MEQNLSANPKIFPVSRKFLRVSLEKSLQDRVSPLYMSEVLQDPETTERKARTFLLNGVGGKARKLPAKGEPLIVVQMIRD